MSNANTILGAISFGPLNDHPLGLSFATPEDAARHAAAVAAQAALERDAARYRYLKEVLSERSRYNDIASYNGDLDATLDHLLTVFPLPSQYSSQDPK